ncbi:MAG: tRNA (adenosine(37)-N6)-dimethylallyltransferase, partial [Actinomycetota bacterium]
MTIQAARRDEPEVARLRVCAIIGPTASGKTDIALRVARAIRAEIVAVDSMTVYRGMDIGTAKPTREQRTAVPHHMLDVVAPGETYTVARFQQAARAAVGAIAARRHVPLLVGGSGLYFRAVVDDLKFPPADAAVRARLAAESPARLAARLRDA